MSNDSKFIDYSVILADLYAKRAGIDAAIQGVIVASGAHNGASVPGAGASFTPIGPNSDHQPTELPRGAFRGKSLPAAVKLYLSAVIKKQSIKEIATALREGGVESTSDNFEGVITGCIHRMKANGELLQFKDGWALAEFYPQHIRAGLSQDKGSKRTTLKKKAKKTRKTSKEAKQPVDPSQSLERRIEAYALEHLGAVVNFKQVADALPGTVPSVVSLTLGRMAKKFGWNKTTDGGYHLVGKVQEMPKAI